MTNELIAYYAAKRARDAALGERPTPVAERPAPLPVDLFGGAR